MPGIRRYRVVCWLLFSLFGLFGCMQEYYDDGKGGNDKESAPLQLGSLLIKEGLPALRSGTQSLTNCEIGIFRYTSTGYSGTRNNVRYRCTNGTWSIPDAGGPIYLTKSPASLCAYYPYSSADDYADGTVTLTSQLYSESADLYYQTGVTASSTSGPVSFIMNHAYAKWVFNFTHDASYTGTCAISQIKIAHADVVSSNTLNMFTGQYGIPGTGSTGSVTIDNVGISGITSGGTQTANVLMVPALSGASPIGNIILTFTVDGEEMMTMVSATQSCLTAGNQYILNVIIKPSPTVTSTANCYIIAPQASLTIPVDIKGNGGDVAGTGLSVTHTAASVGILWQTAPDLILVGNFSRSAQTVKVKAGSSSGNAVIAAYDGPNATGNILWSWHIWVTGYDPNSGGTTYSRSNGTKTYVFMDRNLGATAAATSTATDQAAAVSGLLYQWGRKDPFPGANSWSITNGTDPTAVYSASGTSMNVLTNVQAVSASANFTNSVRNPFVFYKASSSPYDWYTNGGTQNNNLWGGGTISVTTFASKTVFDPCPAGWRVPPWTGSNSPWSGYSSNSFSNYSILLTGIGYYSASGYRYDSAGAFGYVGTGGFYWSASPNSAYGYNLNFYSSGSVYPAYDGYRANGFPVRCVQE